MLFRLLKEGSVMGKQARSLGQVTRPVVEWNMMIRIMTLI